MPVLARTASKEAGQAILCLPSAGPHPADSRPAYVGKTRRGNWADVRTQMNDFTGVILDKLDELGVTDHTIVLWS